MRLFPQNGFAEMVLPPNWDPAMIEPMRRLSANAIAFLLLAAAGLLYVHNYEIWWAHRGRAAFLAFQGSFFDHSITPMHMSASLVLAIFFGAFVFWTLFEVTSRLLLLMFRKALDS
jgi:hypothetical protein